MAIVFVDGMIVVALVDSVAFCVVWSVANFATKKKRLRRKKMEWTGVKNRPLHDELTKKYFVSHLDNIIAYLDATSLQRFKAINLLSRYQFLQQLQLKNLHKSQQ